MSTTVLFAATDKDGDTLTVFQDGDLITVEIEGEDGYRGAFLSTADVQTLAAVFATLAGGTR